LGVVVLTVTVREGQLPAAVNLVAVTVDFRHPPRWRPVLIAMPVANPGP
jgi:hypothetical protein